jgi:high affinity Mn2+ porin
MEKQRGLFQVLLGLSVAFLTAVGRAASDPAFDLHGQATIIPQMHPPFHSDYAGANSLVNKFDLEPTYTATLFSSARLWPGARVYFSPEATAGGGLSGGRGLAGITNGDVTRVGTRALRIYMARLYLQQTVHFSSQDEKKLVWSAGKVSVSDFFDNNTYSHDPRTQFMNWGLMANAAWDYPADSRGYTWGSALDVAWEDWSARAGGFLMPDDANGPHLETDITRANGEVLELEHRHHLRSRPGAIRLLGFWNNADMGHYTNAIETTGLPPDVTRTRQGGNRKYGAGLNAEQEMTPDLGSFMRLGWNDGHTETWAFDEVDRTASIGFNLKGSRWKRSEDVVGLAFLINGLSADHRAYLAAGGSGFLLGDGRLNYGTENIIEAYYLWKIFRFASLTLDFQGIQNPGYNKDRGPLAVGGLRLHIEF